MNKAAALPHQRFCCPLGSIGNTAASDAHPAQRPLPAITGYRTGRSDDRSAASPGRGGPPQFPSPPSRRSTPHTPGGSSGLQSRIHTPSMAFAVNAAARLLLTPRNGRPLTTRQASLDGADRRLAPSNEASHAGLRPDPFPDRAASPLPGLLAATRTGLPPAGDDELMLVSATQKPLQLWAHARSGLGPRLWRCGGP
jgi:hypothetical protein